MSDLTTADVAALAAALGLPVTPDDLVEVTHRLHAPAHASCLGDPVDGRMLAKRVDCLANERQGAPEQRAARNRLRRAVGERLQHPLLGLGAETSKTAKALGFRSRLELLDRRHAELLPEAPRGLRPEAGHTHHVDEPRRNAIAKLGERLQIARLGELDDLPLDRAADAREAGCIALERHLGDRSRGFSDASRRPPVGRQAERVGAVELEQVGKELEAIRELGVPRQRP